MKAISRAIDKFCLKHRKFGVPHLMKYVVFISAAVYLLWMMDATHTLLWFIDFNPALIMRGQVWRLVTWIFVPFNGSVFFTALMLYFYYFVGTTLEREWGAAKFTIYYILGVLLNIIYAFVCSYVSGSVTYLVSEYLNLSLIFAFAVFNPDLRIMLFFLIPLKVKWLALIDAVFFAYSIVMGIINPDINVWSALLPIVSILNFFIICGYELFSFTRPLRARGSPQAINFKKAAKQAKRERDEKQYRHKCSVCGKTDAESPDTEFRYCSRCSGYHCFCIDHINKHTHYKE